MKLAEITEAAWQFRQAIESFENRAELGDAFRDFPKGSCGEVSPLLATYLQEQGFGPFDYVWGWSQEEEPARESHGWLRQEGLVVDITADQFGEEKVIVALNPQWYIRFRVERVRPASFRLEDARTRDRCESVYAKILSKIEGDQPRR